MKKKNQIKDIESENQKIKTKIEKAKSNYSISNLEKHKSKVNHHKSILMSYSPSKNKLDPLIKKIDSKATTSLANIVSYLYLLPFLTDQLTRLNCIEKRSQLKFGLQYQQDHVFA